MWQKTHYKIGRKTGSGVCVKTGAVDYSFNVDINSRKLEVTLVLTKSGKFLKPTFWDRRTEDRVKVNRRITAKIKNELIGSRI
jgi:hypothetical protein